MTVCLSGVREECAEAEGCRREGGRRKRGGGKREEGGEEEGVDEKKGAESLERRKQTGGCQARRMNGRVERRTEGVSAEEGETKQ
jgi:hypothetical protein